VGDVAPEPYLRFGCLSPVEVARQVLAGGWEGAGDFVRQLWRDFFDQVVAGFPVMTQLAVGLREWATTPVRAAC
jgi:deoxyribodipyrimidine photolyase